MFGVTSTFAHEISIKSLELKTKVVAKERLSSRIV